MDNTSFRLKIAYLTLTDPNDRHSWSGTHYYMQKALQQSLGDVDLLGPIKPFPEFIMGQLITGLSQKILGKRYNYRHSKMLAKGYARIANKRLKSKKYDLIVVPATSAFIPYLKTDVPIAYLGDATVINSHNYHKSLTGLYDFSWKETFDVEKMALNKASLIVYPSAWASQSAINDFKIAPDKVFTIPFGANMDNPPPKEIALNKRKTTKCNLLFIGVNWEGKGGPIAYEAFLELNRMGINTSLTVCGCVPPTEYKHENLKVIPFLNKNDSNGFELFTKLFTNASFFVLPTRIDAFGITFCEASAFGVPSIATDTGGVSSALIEGKSGVLLPLPAKGAEYAKVISEIFKDDEKYYNLVKSSRELFESKFNWDSWAEQFKDACYKTVLKAK